MQKTPKDSNSFVFSKLDFSNSSIQKNFEEDFAYEALPISSCATAYRTSQDIMVLNSANDFFKRRTRSSESDFVG